MSIVALCNVSLILPSGTTVRFWWYSASMSVPWRSKIRLVWVSLPACSESIDGRSPAK